MHLAVVFHFHSSFKREAIAFRRYFQKDLKLPSKNIHLYDGRSFEKGIVLSSFLQKISKIKEPLVLYYGGHGCRNGWELSPVYKFPYAAVAQLFKRRSKPTIFVNDCCYGMALKDHLSKLKCQHLLLGLAPKTKEGYGTLVFGITRCWKNRSLADPKLWAWKRNKLSRFILELSAKRLRYGAKLDRLCYQKKPA